MEIHLLWQTGSKQASKAHPTLNSNTPAQQWRSQYAVATIHLGLKIKVRPKRFRSRVSTNKADTVQFH